MDKLIEHLHVDRKYNIADTCFASIQEEYVYSSFSSFEGTKMCFWYNI